MDALSDTTMPDDQSNLDVYSQYDGITVYIFVKIGNHVASNTFEYVAENRETDHTFYAYLDDEFTSPDDSIWPVIRFDPLHAMRHILGPVMRPNKENTSTVPAKFSIIFYASKNGIPVSQLPYGKYEYTEDVPDHNYNADLWYTYRIGERLLGIGDVILESLNEAIASHVTCASEQCLVIAK